MIFEVIAPQPYGVILPTILGYREIKENNMASKCTKCGNTDNYNFALNIGLCDICIGEKLEQQSGRIKELEGKIQSAKDIVSSQSFWCELANQECVGLKSIVHLVEQALKGG